MVQPIDVAWKCCETCEYFGGCRRFTSLGLVVQHEEKRAPCTREGQKGLDRAYLCEGYVRWEILGAIIAGSGTSFAAVTVQNA
jgi:hypothetical protein